MNWSFETVLALCLAVFISLIGHNSANAMDKKPPAVPVTEGEKTSDSFQITGTFQGAGVVCPRFRLDSGETISLSGAVPRDLTIGQSLTLTGLWPMFSKRQQGREFRVQEIIFE